MCTLLTLVAILLLQASILRNVFDYFVPRFACLTAVKIVVYEVFLPGTENIVSH